MSNPDPPQLQTAPKNKFWSFFDTHEKAIKIIGAILGFIFYSIPGQVNAVTGKPFAEWLKEHGINMPFISLLFWGIGIAIAVIIFCHERKMVKDSGYKFSYLPWFYVAGLLILNLIGGLHQKEGDGNSQQGSSQPIQAPQTDNQNQSPSTFVTNAVNFPYESPTLHLGDRLEETKSGDDIIQVIDISGSYALAALNVTTPENGTVPYGEIPPRGRFLTNSSQNGTFIFSVSKMNNVSRTLSIKIEADTATAAKQSTALKP
jgi:hypothetical protein